MEVRHA
jgi:hypothetical protein